MNSYGATLIEFLMALMIATFSIIANLNLQSQSQQLLSTTSRQASRYNELFIPPGACTPIETNTGLSLLSCPKEITDPKRSLDYTFLLTPNKENHASE